MRLFSVMILLLSAALTSSVKAIDIYDGWYWNSSESGWGINVEVQGEIMFIAIFTYRNNGSPVWYYGADSFDYSDPVFQTEMNRADDGACFTCAYQPPDFGEGEGGAITINFDSPDGIQMTWKGRTTNIQRQY